MKDCGRAMEEAKEDFNEKDLVCAGCCDIPVEMCPRHGKEHLTFKCKYCCSVSQWFCWGTTHFCNDCHSRQCKGDYVSKYPIEKLPKCPGALKCALKVKHKPNGQECSLGCLLCQNIKDNKKDF